MRRSNDHLIRSPSWRDARRSRPDVRLSRKSVSWRASVGRLHQVKEKAPETPGLFAVVQFGSVLRDHRAGPVEAVDQRGRDRLIPVVEPNVVTDGKVGDIEQFAGGPAIVEGSTVFGLHEPAGRSDTEDIQAVLYAAANEPAIAVVAAEVSTDGNSSQVEKVRLARL